MDTSARLLNIALRLCGLGALTLGIAFWFGYGRPFTQLHISLGIGVVLSLWALAGLAWMRTARTSLVAFAVTWGVVTWVLGVTQRRILYGSFHWLVEVAHLAVGAIAIAVGGRLATTIIQGATQTESNPADASRAMPSTRP